MQLPFDPMTPEEVDQSSLQVTVEKASQGGFIAIRQRVLKAQNKVRTLCYVWGWTEKEALEKLDTVPV